MAIPLGRPSPGASCDRPERRREGPPGIAGIAPAMPAAPTWSCSRWGFPCRRRCRRRGALLPHHFTLAARTGMPAQAWRCIFCGTVPGVAPAGRYPAPYLRGARTFLSPRRAESGHPAVWRPRIWVAGARLSNIGAGLSCSWAVQGLVPTPTAAANWQVTLPAKSGLRSCVALPPVASTRSGRPDRATRQIGRHEGVASRPLRRDHEIGRCRFEVHRLDCLGKIIAALDQQHGTPRRARGSGAAQSRKLRLLECDLRRATRRIRRRVPPEQTTCSTGPLAMPRPSRTAPIDIRRKPFLTRGA
jgi:hypothetical protein